jgi:hypothetical protein
LHRYYIIYNPRTDKIEPPYGKVNMPGLYPSYSLANKVLKQKSDYGRADKDHEVREVELHIR